jgi:hypothetical protein
MKCARLSSLALATAYFSTLASAVLAFDRYSLDRDSTNCRACHRDFWADGYVSLHDGQAWSVGGYTSLHDVHRQVMLSGDCDTCHSAGPRFPVLTRQSNGGAGLPPIACAGCHGRTGDEDLPASGYGAGLRQHHFRNGVGFCANCHADADPLVYAPVAEDSAPPYYFTPDLAHPGKPTDPCNPGGVGENVAGGSSGLDNDGDDLYDAPYCATLFRDGFETGDTLRWSSALP